MKLPDGWSRAQPLFDDENLVSHAGLVPVLALAERAGLSELISTITHNLLRAAGTLASTAHAVARGARLRRQVVNVPARLALPQRRRVLHLPTHRPWAEQWTTLWRNIVGQATGPPVAA